MLLQLTPLVTLVVRDANKTRCASIHMRHGEGTVYECVSVFETTHKIFDFSSMDPATLKKLEEGFANREAYHGDREWASKRQKTLAISKLDEWRRKNETNRTFVEPPRNSRQEPYESRIFYMEESQKYPGINVNLVKQESIGTRCIELSLRMELPWREPVYGVDVDFLSASNITMVFETLESEEEITTPTAIQALDNAVVLEEFLKQGGTFPENEPDIEHLLFCDVEILELLILYDVKIPSPNKKIDGGTVLHRMFDSGSAFNATLISLLMGLGADPRVKNDDGKTPADCLREQDMPLLWIQVLESPYLKQPKELIDALFNPPMMKILLKKGKTFDQTTPIMKQLINTPNPIRRMLAESKVVIPFPNERISSFNGTALHAVIEQDKVDRIFDHADLRYWLDFGVDPAIKDDNDNTVIDLLRDTDMPVRFVRCIQNYKKK